MKLESCIEAFLFEKDFPTKTEKWYTVKLNQFDEWCREQGITMVEDISNQTLINFTNYLRYTPSTRTGKLNSSHTTAGTLRGIRALLYYAISEDLISDKIMRKFKIPKPEGKTVRVFERKHVNALLRACEDEELTWLMERDKAIIITLLDTGIRAAELCTLTLDNTYLSNAEPYLVVMGKGRKEREVGLGKGARSQLHRYIHRFRPSSNAPWVFLSKKYADEPLTPTGLARLFTRLAERTEIDGVRVSPHTFRHTYAFNFVSGGGDVMRLSRLLGHTSLAVTAEYLKCFTSREARGGRSIADEMLGRGRL